MAEDVALECMAAIRARLVGYPTIWPLVGDRIVDEPKPDIEFPYIRLHRVEPSPDDTDGATGYRVMVGLEVHSRPVAGSVEAAQILGRVRLALHRQHAGMSVDGFSLWSVEFLASYVERAADGASYIGRAAVELRLDA